MPTTSRPVGEHAVAIVPGNPVADEARGRVETQLAGLQLARFDLAEPRLEGLVADLLAQAITDAAPLCPEIIAASVARFHACPRNGLLLFVRWILVVDCHR